MVVAMDVVERTAATVITIVVVDVVEDSPLEADVVDVVVVAACMEAATTCDGRTTLAAVRAASPFARHRTTLPEDNKAVLSSTPRSSSRKR